MYSENQIKHKISNAIREVDSDAEVFLFGSKARNQANENSDWDLLVLTNHPVSLQDEQTFRHKLVDVELEVEEPLSVFVYYKKEWDTKYTVTPFLQKYLPRPL